jgi:hypothetical protein
MATKLTPNTLRRLVLEEKAKVEKQLDKKALKMMEMDAEHEGDWSHPSGQRTVKQTPGKKLQTLKMLKEQEEALRGRLRAVTERRIALRRQLMEEIG